MSPDGHQLEFITYSKNVVKSPVTFEDLGRYRCIATNEFGSRSRDAILTKLNDTFEYLIYGFVDKKSNNLNEDFKIVRLRSKFVKAKNDPNIILKIKNSNQIFKLGSYVNLKCFAGKLK